MSTPPPSSRARRPSQLSTLGTEFEDWLTDHGRWCVYARADRRIKCSCFDDQTQASGASKDGGPEVPGDDGCPLCFGTGYKTTLERMKAYVAYDVRKTYSTRSGIAPAYVGEVDTSGAVVYLRGGERPAKLDLLFEVEWDRPYGPGLAAGGTPTRLVRAWEIMNPAPAILGSQGAVDLYMAGMRSHGEQLTQLEENLRGAGGKITAPGAQEEMTPIQDRPYGGPAGNRYRHADSPSRVTGKPRFV